MAMKIVVTAKTDRTIPQYSAAYRYAEHIIDTYNTGDIRRIRELMWTLDAIRLTHTYGERITWELNFKDEHAYTLFVLKWS